jgi:hypothetical protein
VALRHRRPTNEVSRTISLVIPIFNQDYENAELHWMHFRRSAQFCVAFSAVSLAVTPKWDHIFVGSTLFHSFVRFMSFGKVVSLRQDVRNSLCFIYAFLIFSFLWI